MISKWRPAGIKFGVFMLAVFTGLGAPRGWGQTTGNIAANATLGGQTYVAAPLASTSSAQNPFLGSISSGKAVPGTLQLSIDDAIERGLRFNLGALLSEQSSESARGARWQALSHLLPHVNAGVTETDQQINLEALGFPPSLITRFPGFPVIVGPFTTFDARASLTAPLLDLHSLHQVHAASDDVRAAAYSYQDARNTVVLAVGNAYLLANAAQARVQSAQAELNTAQALYQQAVDRLHAGLSPEIDELRAEVELKSQQEQLLTAQNAFDTDKLNLARIIGLPSGQQFALSSETPYSPLQGVTIQQALAEAYQNRPDYKAALVQVRAAEQARRAALDERLPSVSFNSNFGDIGLTPGNSHETFGVSGTLNIPIFQGGRVRGDLIQANAQLKQSQDQLQNLKGQIDYDVRTALLNLKTAAGQVNVARTNIELAHRTLQQARDRFAAGVTDNIEVVEAQEAVANADEAYISSLYQHNLAKVSLAQALGVADRAVMQYLGGR